MTVAKVQETRSTRTSGSFRRTPSLRQRITPAPPGTGAVSVSVASGAPSTSAVAPDVTKSSLAREGPQTVSSDTASPDRHAGRSAAFTLPGAAASLGSDGHATAAHPTAFAATALGEHGGPASIESAKEPRSPSNSGVLRGVVVLGEGGQPVLVDEDNGGPDAAVGAATSVGEHGSRSARGARHSTVEMMDLEVVKSENGDAAALFRAVTPAETARRKPPGAGWLEDEDDRHVTGLDVSEHSSAT